MKGTRLINRFSVKKNFIWVNGPFWAQKMAHTRNSGSAVRIFLKFCTMKGANR